MREGTSEDAVELFSVAHLLLGLKPTLKSSLFPSEALLEKKNLSFASGYVLEIGSRLGMGRLYIYPSSSRTLVQTSAGPVRTASVSQFN